MALIYSTEGYFCEGDVDGNWQFSMQLGKILLSNQYLTLLKESNISLTAIISSINNFNEGYNIPLKKIRKVYPLKQGKIYTLKIETRDNHYFSITLANNETNGKTKCNELSETINSTILYIIKTEGVVSNNKKDSQDKKLIKYCKFCGAKILLNDDYCKICGMEL